MPPASRWFPWTPRRLPIPTKSRSGYRRLLINGIFWAAGLEDKITPELAIDFIGPYQPSTFSFDGYVKKVKPADLAGFESPIMPKSK